ncbi:MAG: DUF6364 family protein [Pseudomonadota bacterium]
MKTTTTIRLPDSLLARAKKKAREDGTTLTALIEEGLQDVISRKPRAAKRVRPPISSVRGAVMPGVDLTRSAELQEIMDDDAIRQAGLIKLK